MPAGPQANNQLAPTPFYDLAARLANGTLEKHLDSIRRKARRSGGRGLLDSGDGSAKAGRVTALLMTSERSK